MKKRMFSKFTSIIQHAVDAVIKTLYTLDVGGGRVAVFQHPPSLSISSQIPISLKLILFSAYNNEMNSKLKMSLECPFKWCRLFAETKLSIYQCYRIWVFDYPQRLAGVLSFCQSKAKLFEKRCKIVTPFNFWGFAMPFNQNPFRSMLHV